MQYNGKHVQWAIRTIDLWVWMSQRNTWYIRYTIWRGKRCRRGMPWVIKCARIIIQANPRRTTWPT